MPRFELTSDFTLRYYDGQSEPRQQKGAVVLHSYRVEAPNVTTGKMQERSIALLHASQRSYYLLPENAYEIDEWLRQLRMTVQKAKERVAEQAKVLQSKTIRSGYVDLEINAGFQRKWCLLGINEQGQAVFCFGKQEHPDVVAYFDACPTWRQVCVLPPTPLGRCALTSVAIARRSCR